MWGTNLLYCLNYFKIMKLGRDEVQSMKYKNTFSFMLKLTKAFILDPLHLIVLSSSPSYKNSTSLNI